MHRWGDENVDWEGIEECCHILYKICTKYGRLGGQLKEKWGEIRFYARFEKLSLHSLIYPGYHFIQFPNWLYKLDNKVISPVLNFFFGKVFLKYQRYMYRLGYKRCLKAYPHLREEILSASDHDNLLEGL